MDKIIREIVEADKQARQRVKQKQKERLDIKNKILLQKENIQEKYQNEMRATLDKKRVELETAFQEECKKEDEKYNEALHNLDVKYQAGKEQWMHEIMDRCLKNDHHSNCE